MASLVRQNAHLLSALTGSRLLTPGIVRAASSHSEPVVFEDEVSLEFKDGVAVVTLKATSGEFAWGTKREEHRWNPTTVKAFSQALDTVEAAGESMASALVVANAGKFWSNGFDLKYAASHATEDFQEKLNEIMTRVCCFPLPTVAALDGHWVAAGGMMGLAFDYRVMASDRGFFFIPGVDLGLIYAPLQIALMKSKLSPEMQREVIVFNSKRWNGEALAQKGIVECAVPSKQVLAKAMELAASLKPKGSGGARKALGGIKRAVYKDVVEACAAGGGMNMSGTTKGVEYAPTSTSKL